MHVGASVRKILRVIRLVEAVFGPDFAGVLGCGGILVGVESTVVGGGGCALYHDQGPGRGSAGGVPLEQTRGSLRGSYCGWLP